MGYTQALETDALVANHGSLFSTDVVILTAMGEEAAVEAKEAPRA